MIQKNLKLQRTIMIAEQN